MRIISLRENLKHGLSMVGGIAGRNPNLPILNNVLIKTENKNIKLITTDLEIGIVSTIRGKMEKEGVFTVNAKTISDYVNLLPNKKIEIDQQGENLEIKCENYKTKIKGQVSDDFPLIPKVEKENKIKIKTEELKKALNQVVFSVASGDSRIELSGVLFSFDKEELTLAATDSYRLAEKKISIKSEDLNEINKKTEDENKKIIVPSKAIQELLKIISSSREKEEHQEGEKETEVYISENQILFINGSTELVSRLIEGQYPDYKQIIPDKTKTSVTLDKTEFIRAVKTSSLFSKKGVNDINLDFPEGKNQVIISSASGQTGENIVEIDAQKKGKDNSVVINYQYLLDGLKTIEEDFVKLEVVDNNTPCLLKPVKNSDYIYIIMTIKQ